MKIPAAGPERSARMIELATQVCIDYDNGRSTVRADKSGNRRTWGSTAHELALIVLAEHGDRTPTKEH